MTNGSLVEGREQGKREREGKGKKKPTKDIFTKNIVYKEILTP
jgi:hypothetical protein